MANLYEILADAQQGEAIAELGREFGLTTQQTQAAVAALLPAISMGLKRSTATPEGLGNLFALMGAQPDLTRCMMTRRLLSPAGTGSRRCSLIQDVWLARCQPRDRRSGATIVRRQFNRI